MMDFLRKRLLGLHANPGRYGRWLLGLLPFLLVLVLYSSASSLRRAENPQDKLLPSFSQMASAMHTAALEKSRRTGDRILWTDTAASLKRLLLGVALAAIAGLTLGILTGLYPGGNALIHPFLTVIAMVPPLSVLPILFITLGIDELAKVSLIVIGLFALLARDMHLSVEALPGQQITKALTLGATNSQLIVKIILPQVLPRLIESVRLSLGAAWLFLIAAEAIASNAGLGYRIFLVRRYLAMDMILPYVAWITLLGFAMDLGLRGLLRWAFPWYIATRTR